jgi:hypothetical protein
MGEWLLSRRDGATVAWHEVPRDRPPKEPSRRVQSDSRRRAHGSMLGVTKFRMDHTVTLRGRFSRWTLSQALRARPAMSKR